MCFRLILPLPIQKQHIKLFKIFFPQGFLFHLTPCYKTLGTPSPQLKSLLKSLSQNAPVQTRPQLLWRLIFLSTPFFYIGGAGENDVVTCLYSVRQHNPPLSSYIEYLINLPSLFLNAVLSKVPTDGECALENNTLLDIDLSAVDQGGQYRGAEDDGFLGLGLQPWVLIAAVASGLALLLLIITLSLVICRMLTRRHKRCRRDSFDLYDSTARIRAEKGPPGTDVWYSQP